MFRSIVGLFVVMSLIISCQSPKQKKVDFSQTSSPVATVPESTDAKKCQSPRPQMCTKEFRPVCATRDTGIRCVTTPCPSSEMVTKSNACTACSDDKVISYIQGVCSS